MKEKLLKSAKSSNFWNNIANIASLAVLLGILSYIQDKEAVKEIILAFLAGNGSHNIGNIMAHMNKD